MSATLAVFFLAKTGVPILKFTTSQSRKSTGIQKGVINRGRSRNSNQCMENSLEMFLVILNQRFPLIQFHNLLVEWWHYGSLLWSIVLGITDFLPFCPMMYGSNVLNIVKDNDHNLSKISSCLKNLEKAGSSNFLLISWPDCKQIIKEKLPFCHTLLYTTYTTYNPCYILPTPSEVILPPGSRTYFFWLSILLALGPVLMLLTQ